MREEELKTLMNVISTISYDKIKMLVNNYKDQIPAEVKGNIKLIKAIDDFMKTLESVNELSPKELEEFKACIMAIILSNKVVNN